MSIKILIGGSPCTNWSIAQKNNRETTAEGVGWELFKNYLIAKEKFNPDFFLYENNKSAAQVIKDQIAYELGVGTDPMARFTYINSALVSAQNRQRFYITNFGEIEQPVDKGILLRDVLETGENLTKGDKSFCLTASYDGACAWNTIEHSQRTMVAEPVEHGNAKNLLRNFKTGNERTNTLTASCCRGIGSDGTTTVAEPVRVGDFPNSQGKISGSQGTRIYAIEGKSVALVANGGGQGAKTGLYAIPIEFDGDIPLKAISSADGKTYPVYEVLNGLITIKGEEYPIKLLDGYYIIRKLTVKECCRLQTMPDDYCKAVSNSQAYKGLGNGWTAEVIIHLLSHALKKISKDEEIIVLSMYDGIGTGRYCLDKMGFTNVTYHAYEIDKYAMAVAMDNYLDIIQNGDAFAVRKDDWKPPQTRFTWLDALLEVM